MLEQEFCLQLADAYFPHPENVRQASASRLRPTWLISKLQMTTAGKNMKSCDQNDEAFWSHDYTKFKF